MITMWVNAAGGDNQCYAAHPATEVVATATAEPVRELLTSGPISMHNKDADAGRYHLISNDIDILHTIPASEMQDVALAPALIMFAVKMGDHVRITGDTQALGEHWEYPTVCETPSGCAIQRPSHTQSQTSVPLGHPQRPLYTAIWKNMSPPTIPPESASTIASAALRSSVYGDCSCRSLDIPPTARSQFLMMPYPRSSLLPMSGSPSGFSMSGEMELRMELARCRSMDGVPSGYMFHEVKRPMGMVL
ncbi:hypothetical protein A0H81_08023 [Grifola frondosa]|uniref:Uncharacterized protein n=1 Tax=Grifola frondosa TaxID=5627 RepID=A0A1C7M702_GRIFR|nr:hypothetical protein A0H81_08023 [Grifola frondosa]